MLQFFLDILRSTHGLSYFLAQQLSVALAQPMNR
jgi:hypothetical protein